MVKGTCVCANTGEDIVANLITPGGGSGETKEGTGVTLPPECEGGCIFDKGKCLLCSRTDPSKEGGRRRKKKTRRKSRRKKRKTRRKTRRRKKKRKRRKSRRKRRVHKKHR